MEMKRPRSSDDNNGVNNNDRPADLCEKKRKTEDPSDVDNDRPAAHSTESVETRPARLNSSEMEVNQPSDDVNNNDRPVPRSTESAATCRAPPDLCQMTLPCDDGNNNDRAAYSASPAETCPAQLNSSETEVGQPSGDGNNNDQPSAHSTGSGLGRLSADGWHDVFPNLRFYENAILRFTSAAMNRLIRRSAPTLPLRVIAALVAVHTDEGYRACGFEDDKRTPWRDLVTGVHASPESMLRDVLTRCEGSIVDSLELRDLPYNDKVLAAMQECIPCVSVSEVFFDGVASGHENVPRLLEIVPGLNAATLVNDARQPNAATFLDVCATRRTPNATLNYAMDVTEADIVNYLFDGHSPRITRQFGICSLRRSLSGNFFGMIVERCRNSACKALRFGMAGILTDPTDAKYERFVVERDDSTAMYKFRKAAPTDASFTVLVGLCTVKKHFYLRVFQGDYDDLCTSLAAAKKITTCRISLPP